MSASPAGPPLRTSPASTAATFPPPPPVDDLRSSARITPRPGAGLRSRWRVLGFGAAALAGCAYIALFDPNGSSALYPRCPFNAVTGLDCPGCGITRALHALATGDVGRALDHNVLFVLALPILLWWFTASTVRRTGRRFPGPELRWRPWMTIAVAVLFGSFWVLRNLPGLHWLAASAT